MICIRKVRFSIEKREYDNWCFGIWLFDGFIIFGLYRYTFHISFNKNKGE